MAKSEKKSDRGPFAMTHKMMRHPRAADAKNVDVQCIDDTGNGSGLFVDADGNDIVVMADKKDTTDGAQLFEELGHGKRIRVSVVRA